MEKDAKIYVAGHKGMVGSAICRALQRNGYTNIITRSHKELDLCRQDAVEEFFSREKPDYVFLAAAKVGGIMANSEALADFMYENMILEMNVIHAAWQNNCKKLMFLGSSCIYPRMAPQPMKESCLLTSELEKTNEAYALAKFSGLKYCEFLNSQYGTDYISVMAKVVGYTGEIKWDPSKPDGTPRKLLDVSKLESLGYHYTTELEEGIRLTYEDFLNNPMRAER